MAFKTRCQAGKLLAVELKKYEQDHPLVLANPRGGVEVAEGIIGICGYPWGLLIRKKISAPWNKELAIGLAKKRRPLRSSFFRC